MEFRWASLLGEIAYQGEECGGSDESVGKWRWCAERLRDDGGWWVVDDVCRNVGKGELGIFEDLLSIIVSSIYIYLC